jgi:hypothetical protein
MKRYVWRGCAAILLVLIWACSAKHAALQDDAQPKTLSMAGEQEPACGDFIEAFEQRLSTANHCEIAADCDRLEVSISGCWNLFHKDERAVLLELQRKAMLPRCRVFVPTFKCTSQPGQVVCRKQRCAWQTAGSGE